MALAALVARRPRHRDVSGSPTPRKRSMQQPATAPPSTGKASGRRDSPQAESIRSDQVRRRRRAKGSPEAFRVVRVPLLGQTQADPVPLGNRTHAVRAWISGSFSRKPVQLRRGEAGLARIWAVMRANSGTADSRQHMRHRCGHRSTESQGEAPHPMHRANTLPCIWPDRRLP